MPAEQPTLFDAAAEMRPLEEPAATGGNTEESFREFLRLNPWVYGWFEARALELVRRGHQRIGINMLCEVFRYEQMRSTVDPNGAYKINNNYAPYLSRELASRNPILAEAFEFRRSRADSVHDFSSQTQSSQPYPSSLIPMMSVAARSLSA